MLPEQEHENALEEEELERVQEAKLEAEAYLEERKDRRPVSSVGRAPVC